MLSILIPIYNSKVVKLVDELIDQCKKAKTNFEIICLDDGSASKYKAFNQEINGRFGVNYVELLKNVGRARIRNRLAKLARYEWLLYLDSDSKIGNKKFVRSYLQKIELLEVDVLIGGTQYKKTPPSSQDKLLHWYYGHKREALSAKKKNRHPARYFHSNNFVIKRSVIFQHPFEETLDGYGYEDIALGQRLLSANFSIIHIDNPILHIGLKSCSDFLSDQKESISNLAKLYKSGSIKDSRLIHYYEFIVRLKIMSIIIFLLKSRENLLLERLKRNPKALISLDFLKLLYFDQALKSTHTKA